MAWKVCIVAMMSVLLVLGIACDGDDQGDEDVGRTGVEAVDDVIVAFESDDAGPIRELVAFSTLPCTEVQGAGGPPKCATGEVEGDEISAFEFYSCELDWRREDTVDAALREVAETSPKVYAAFPGSTVRDDAGVAEGEYVVVFQGTDFDGVDRGSAAVVDSEGNVVAVHLACGVGDGADVYVPEDQTDFLLGPGT